MNVPLSGHGIWFPAITLSSDRTYLVVSWAWWCRATFRHGLDISTSCMDDGAVAGAYKLQPQPSVFSPPPTATAMLNAERLGAVEPTGELPNSGETGVSGYKPVSTSESGTASGHGNNFGVKSVELGGV